MPTTSRDPRVRHAVAADVGELVRLRRAMFDALGAVGVDDGWEVAAADHLRAVLAVGSLVAAVVDAPDGSGTLAACGVIEFVERIPAPSNPTGRAAFIASMSTEPAWRRHGFARVVVEALLAEAADRGVTRVELHASPDGIELYRQLGFVERGAHPEMRLSTPTR